MRKKLAILLMAFAGTVLMSLSSTALALSSMPTDLSKVRDRLVGIKSEPMADFIQFTMSHPAVVRFGLSIYKGSPDCGHSEMGTPARWLMLPADIGPAAERVGEALLDTQLRTHELSADDVFDFRPGTLSGTEPTTVAGAWEPHAIIGLQAASYSENEERFVVPVSEAEIHELGHVERMRVNDKFDFTPRQYKLIMALEIGTTLEEMIASDAMYKSVNRIDPDEEVHYSQDVLGTKMNVNPGRLANFFRDLIARTGQAEYAVMSPEGQAFISRYFDSSECPD